MTNIQISEYKKFNKYRLVKLFFRDVGNEAERREYMPVSVQLV